MNLHWLIGKKVIGQGVLLRAALVACITLFFPVRSVASEPSCKGIHGLIHTLSTSAISDSLTVALGLIDHARANCESARPPEMQVWLIEKQIFILDKLRRFDEAEQAVNFFFDRLEDIASPQARARVFAWRFRFLSLRGELLSAVTRYHEAKEYLPSLPLERELHFHLDAAYAYQKVDSPEEALKLVLFVLERAPSGTSAHARAQTMQAEIILTFASRSDAPNADSVGLALSLLDQAEGVFESQNLPESKAVVFIERGRALALLGRYGEALTVLSDALEIARDDGSSHIAVIVFFQRALVFEKMGSLDDATDDLAASVALMDSTGLYEYSSQVSEALGRVFERMEQWKEAISHYQQASQASHHRQNVEAIQAARRADAALIRLALEGKGTPSFPWGTALLFIGLIAGIGIGFNLARRRYHHPEAARVFPDMEPPMPLSSPPDLFDKRRAYIYRALTQPEEALPFVEDPFVRDMIERRDIQMCSDLFTIASVFEAHETGRFFANPANTYRNQLRPRFKKLGWSYPRTVLAWREHFARKDA